MTRENSDGVGLKGGGSCPSRPILSWGKSSRRTTSSQVRFVSARALLPTGCGDHHALLREKDGGDLTPPTLPRSGCEFSRVSLFPGDPSSVRNLIGLGMTTPGTFRMIPIVPVMSVCSWSRIAPAKGGVEPGSHGGTTTEAALAPPLHVPLAHTHTHAPTHHVIQRIRSDHCRGHLPVHAVGVVVTVRTLAIGSSVFLTRGVVIPLMTLWLSR